MVSLENHATTEQDYNTADLTCLESKEQAETHLEKLRAPADTAPHPITSEIINRMEAVWGMPLSCWKQTLVATEGNFNDAAENLTQKSLTHTETKW